jgi:GTPase
MLFATLDPTMRQIVLPGIDKAILSDTVGFVSDLPTQLVAAFRATLEEVTTADFIIHVRDISHTATDAQRDDVMSILNDLGIGGDDGSNVPIIELWNKIDLLDPENKERLENVAEREADRLMISAQTGEGVDDFVKFISSQLIKDHQYRNLEVKSDNGAALAWLHSKGLVRILSENETTLSLEVSLSRQSWGQYDKIFGVN